MVSDELDAVVEKVPTCQTLAFGDLGTSMVLLTNSASELARERVDALCAEAVATLGPQDMPPLGTGNAEWAMTLTPAATKVFLRGGPEGSDCLLCLCAPEVDLESLLPELQTCLDTILGS